MGDGSLAGLYLVATPIGNLADITLRGLAVLRGADRIFCEDTRVTGKLLARYGISTPLAAYGVFLDHYGGWVARGTWAETAELMALGIPVWWFNSGEPADRFGFGPPRPGDYARFHRRVGLGYGRPVLATRTRPLRALHGGHRTLRGVLDADHP